ncbi:hypothetical protein QAD02_008227 [Eretmocerus hayati]|uniref:Uncharacterized protein n=1 Tax=Eretmocerus hayati TaxID=131215 RepID=A0ACC2N5V4_9HYME|nr:hypothetical protein QAD02_008227 [Eretmocerus hayati]
MVKKSVTEDQDYSRASKYRKQKELGDSSSESDEDDASADESTSDDDSVDGQGNLKENKERNFGVPLSSRTTIIFADTSSEATKKSKKLTSSDSGERNSQRDSEQGEYKHETARSYTPDHDEIYYDCEENYYEHETEGDGGKNIDLQTRTRTHDLS